jgi:hypothetical protein
MRNLKFWALFLALFVFILHAPGSFGTPNAYGEFFETKIKDDYTVTFIANLTNRRFPKVEEASMIDYGNDDEGDVSRVLYRNGNQEIFFRTKRGYGRYVGQNESMDVCKGDLSFWYWLPKKIYYRKKQNRWECLSVGLERFIWGEIDDGLADAKRGNWDALIERLLKIAGENKK